ncbi:hypothetical protein N7495_000965 [Penicillium taxi]|uniref:uncharacterized protein n=1 Tax=Penicillium taxi TaxID=168475 RepID=UPI002544ED3A|nr:uncharacterized protein N7495_000965 [Penicillium taxi]KAJ5908283.1 hypothetical protein N7495_000965 [Penicillium taxi]
MGTDPGPSSLSSSPLATFPRNAPTQVRRRGLRSRTSTEGMPDWPQRRNSTLSDSISEARNSIRSSTDDLFLPRLRSENPTTEESHWHSTPLALALLPAIAGILFKDGSAFVTDVTLLVLAAIFLNWSVRLPWDWYRSAQAVQQEPESDVNEPVKEADGADEGESTQQRPKNLRSAGATASRELLIHELAALASCFIFPIIGTWVLHAIRSSLSRPSEGLVSNYNLTIFLLAAEVRPFAHLLKLVQARTLHLQRIVASSSEDHIDPSKVQDLTKRLEELEAHVAETAAARLNATSENELTPSPTQPSDAPSIVIQASVEARRALQPDIEALNRAVRRYEKRLAFSSLQCDTRYHSLESQARDTLALAAAAQRSSASKRQNNAMVLIDWACACIVVPSQFAISLLNLPGRITSRCLDAAKNMIGWRRKTVSHPRSKSSKGKSVQVLRGSKTRAQLSPPRQMQTPVSMETSRSNVY